MRHTLTYMNTLTRKWLVCLKLGSQRRGSICLKNKKTSTVTGLPFRKIDQHTPMNHYSKKTALMGPRYYDSAVQCLKKGRAPGA